MSPSVISVTSRRNIVLTFSSGAISYSALAPSVLIRTFTTSLDQKGRHDFPSAPFRSASNVLVEVPSCQKVHHDQFRITGTIPRPMGGV